VVLFQPGSERHGRHNRRRKGMSVTNICDSRFPASGCPMEEIAVEC
jgi:hypothetical protein